MRDVPKKQMTYKFGSDTHLIGLVTYSGKLPILVSCGFVENNDDRIRLVRIHEQEHQYTLTDKQVTTLSSGELERLREKGHFILRGAFINCRIELVETF